LKEMIILKICDMSLQNNIINCNYITQLPKIENIKSIDRGIELIIIFGHNIKKRIEEIGNNWKNELPDFFLITILPDRDIIRINKLITNSEIEQNQLFLENCAKEYGRLGEELMNRFIEEFEIKPHGGIPLRTINLYGKNSSHGGRGLMGEWYYKFHGMELRFTHQITKQEIEILLTSGEEYGTLDSCFFLQFIKSTPEFRPLPIKILDDYWDGHRILNVMTELGKFEKINTNFSNELCRTIVKDRVKKEIKVFNDQDFFEEILFDGTSTD